MIFKINNELFLVFVDDFTLFDDRHETLDLVIFCNLYIYA